MALFTFMIDKASIVLSTRKVYLLYTNYYKYTISDYTIL